MRKTNLFLSLAAGLAYSGNGMPFSRAAEYQRVAGVAIRGGVSPLEVIAAMGDYKSRGKGRGRNTGLTLAKVYRRSPNKYTPHQGAQEIARRVRQQEARNG